MAITHRMEHWANTHHPAWLDLFRVGLGLFLFYKGIVFISDISVLESLLINIHLDWTSFIFAHYIAFAHLVGGLLIALGLVTRAAILFQLPILVGAVLFVHPEVGMNTLNTSWWISLVTLIFLIVFFFYGSGQWSIDNYMRNHRES